MYTERITLELGDSSKGTEERLLLIERIIPQIISAVIKDMHQVEMSKFNQAGLNQLDERIKARISEALLTEGT